MASRVRFRVRGLRHLSSPANLKQQVTRLLQRALDPFRTALARAVGERVAERLRRGAWHRSRAKRGDYYHSWVRFRYGSDRRRKASPGLGGSFADLDGALSDSVKRHQMLFLARNLHRVKRAVGPDGMQDVDALAERLSNVLQQYRRTLRTDETAARAYLTSQHAEITGEGSSYTRFLRESRVGQRLMRQTERLALRHLRNEMLLGGLDEGRASRRGALRLDAAERARYLRGLRSRRGPPVLVSGGHKFGYETGAWAQSWRNASGVLEGLRIRVTPDPSGDVVKTNRGPRSLTDLLKRTVQKQGGNPNLLTRKLAKEAVEAALDAVRDEWAQQRIRRRV